VESGIQPCGYLLELSLDWIVERASENVHHLLGESHVTLIDEPLGRFVHSQALHDLRNLFSRLSGTTGVARAYRVRLTDEHALFDIAFQQVRERVILEAVPSPAEGLGEALGVVGGLIDSLGRSSRETLIESGARRFRALTAFDRVTFLAGETKATSSRTGVPFSAGANATLSNGFPPLVCDSNCVPVPVFPRQETDAAVGAALLRGPSAEQKAELHERGFAATMRLPVMLDGAKIGEFRCAHVTPRPPNFELHAAAELFAQMFAMRLEVERLKAG
jgi:light-regulated signal transduction histidine kinase (bacteriophytochrome)